MSGSEIALHVITDKILQAMDGGESSILVLIDLSKCFDVGPHEICYHWLQASQHGRRPEHQHLGLLSVHFHVMTAKPLKQCMKCCFDLCNHVTMAWMLHFLPVIRSWMSSANCR